MSHDTHQANDKQTERNKSKVAFTSSFWLVVILVGLFVAALNFIAVMSHEEEEGHEGTKTEMHESGKHEETTGHEAAKPDEAHKADTPQTEENKEKH